MARRKKILVTAGPTRAYLDSVRYLTNPSSGATGFSICREFEKKGWDVFLISGPCVQDFSSLRLKKHIQVETVDQMSSAVHQICVKERPELAVLSAAVLDFEPERTLKTKTSSKKKSWVIRLKPTRKIIDEIRQRHPSIRVVGFKLESEMRTGKKRDDFAKGIIIKKGLAGLCLNFLSEVGASDHRAYLYSSSGLFKKVATKGQLSKGIFDLVGTFAPLHP